MRKVLTAMIAIAVFGVAAWAQQPEKAQASHTVLKVSGMHCGACAKTVEKTAKKIVGVTAATASHPKGTAEITYDPGRTNPEAIAKAISDETAFKAQAPKAGQNKQ